MYYDSQKVSGISEIMTRVQSMSVIISDIPRLVSLLIVLSTDLTTYRRLPNDIWFHHTTSNSYPLIKFVAATYPPAYFVTAIQPDIGLKGLFKKTHKMSYQ
jgi:hypothetical protein